MFDNIFLCVVIISPAHEYQITTFSEYFQHFPNHTKGLILMGDININHIKDLDAAEVNFKTILANDPRHIQANHNLCVVYVERADLITAEKCLARTLDMAPNEKYIQQHLNIVRNRIFKVQQVWILYVCIYIF